MNCRFDRELVSMYADGELRRDRVVYVETHISGCDECGTIVHEMRHIGNALSALTRSRAPHELVERIVIGAGPTVRHPVWSAAKWTAGAVLRVAMRGFAVDDELEEVLRRESPPWVARWVLFV
jgi:predicted anti-sigma-YlaC factor YlaD